MSEHHSSKTGKKKAIPPPRPVIPPIIDAKTAQEMQDEEFARAIQESINQEAYNGDHHDHHDGGDLEGAWGYDADMEELRRQQMEMDEEIARQLMEEFNQERNPPARRRDPGNLGIQDDDIDNIMEQFRINEAQERLKRSGNAFEAPINIDRVMEEQDEEDERIRQQYEARFKQEESRRLREEQDAEYEALLAASLESEPLPNIPNPDTIPDESNSSSSSSSSESDEEPLIKPTTDQLRRARLAYFMNKPKP